MSTPVSAPAPPRPSTPPIGCVPFLVFILTLAAAAGWLVLRADLLPKESAGRTVIEILGRPTAAEMKAHEARIQSGAVLTQAAKNLGPGTSSRRSAEHVAEWLRRSIEVQADGPFLTITAITKDYAPAELASAVAIAYGEDLKEQVISDRRRESQTRQAYIPILQADAEKARLTWLEFIKKSGLAPDGHDAVGEAAMREFATSIAKERAAIIRAEIEIAHPVDAIAPEVLAKRQASLSNRREVLKQLETGLAELSARSLDRASRETEAEHVRVKLEQLNKLLHQLQEETLTATVRESVVLQPIRIVENADIVKVADPELRKTVRLVIYGSLAGLAALLLAALAAKLSRRAVG